MTAFKVQKCNSPKSSSRSLIKKHASFDQRRMANITCKDFNINEAGAVRHDAR